MVELPLTGTDHWSGRYKPPGPAGLQRTSLPPLPNSSGAQRRAGPWIGRAWATLTTFRQSHLRCCIGCDARGRLQPSDMCTALRTRSCGAGSPVSCKLTALRALGQSRIACAGVRSRGVRRASVPRQLGCQGSRCITDILWSTSRGALPPGRTSPVAAGSGSRTVFSVM